jgi:CRISPR-associated protein Csm3
MFQKMTNAARIKMTLETSGPLLIKAGDATSFDPALPDMYAIRTHKDGALTVFLPGSSLKGVFRSRYEAIINGLLEDDRACCNVAVQFNSCKTVKNYQDGCPACKLFGSTKVAGRIRFIDAYPIGTPILGHRHGVGIDRITGGASGTAKYDYEIVEEAKFEVTIWMENYELYQMALLLQVLQDIDDGFVGFGMGTTRGNGYMQVASCEVMLRDYRKDMKLWIGCQKGCQGEAISYQDKFYYNEALVADRNTLMSLLPVTSELLADLRDDRRKGRD